MNSIAEMIHSEAVRRKITARACELFSQRVKDCRDAAVDLHETDVCAFWAAAVRTAQGEAT